MATTNETTPTRSCPYCGRVTYRGVFINGTNGHAHDCPRLVVKNPSR